MLNLFYVDHCIFLIGRKQYDYHPRKDKIFDSVRVRFNNAIIRIDDVVYCDLRINRLVHHGAMQHKRLYNTFGKRGSIDQLHDIEQLNRSETKGNSPFRKIQLV